MSYIYIDPCMGLSRQHASITSILAKCNSRFWVLKLCSVLSSKMGCTIDWFADPAGVIGNYGPSCRELVTCDVVRNALDSVDESVR